MRSGGPALRVVVDTNVWVSGLILPDSLPGQVLDAARHGRLTPVASWALAGEVAEVLRRPRLKPYGVTEHDVQDVLAVLAPFLPSVEVDVPTRDPDDAPAIAAAVSGRAEAIVTGDRDLLQHAPLRAWLDKRGITVLTPTRLMKRLADL